MRHRSTASGRTAVMVGRQDKALRPRRASPSVGKPCWRLLATLGVLLTASVAAGEIPPLPRPSVSQGDDARWLESLPPLVVPLPKSAEPLSRLDSAAMPSHVERTFPTSDLAAPPPSMSETPFEQTRSGDALAERAALEMAPSPIDSDALAGEHPPEGSGNPAVSGEPSEDASRIEVLERQVIGVASDRSEAAPAAHIQASAGDGQRTADSPASATSAAPSLAEVASSVRYRWQVQLLAGRSLDKVKADRQSFVQRHGALLDGLTLTISQSRFGDARDEFYRLRALEWTAEAEARQWCARLSAAGGQCLVTRVTLPGE